MQKEVFFLNKVIIIIITVIYTWGLSVYICLVKRCKYHCFLATRARHYFFFVFCSDFMFWQSFSLSFQLFECLKKQHKMVNK